MHTSQLARALVVCAALLACESSMDVPGPTPYAATLAGTNVQPTAVTTSATGSLNASLHPTNVTLSYTLAWTGLSGAVTAAHLHGPATSTTVGALLIDFSELPTGSSGSMTMTAAGSATGSLNLGLAINATVSGDSLKKLLNAGLVYADVHTAANGGGEIRGQIVKK